MYSNQGTGKSNIMDMMKVFFQDWNQNNNDQNNNDQKNNDQKNNDQKNNDQNNNDQNNNDQKNNDHYLVSIVENKESDTKSDKANDLRKKIKKKQTIEFNDLMDYVMSDEYSPIEYADIMQYDSSMAGFLKINDLFKNKDRDTTESIKKTIIETLNALFLTECDDFLSEYINSAINTGIFTNDQIKDLLLECIKKCNNKYLIMTETSLFIQIIGGVPKVGTEIMKYLFETKYFNRDDIIVILNLMNEYVYVNTTIMVSRSPETILIFNSEMVSLYDFFADTVGPDAFFMGTIYHSSYVFGETYLKTEKSNDKKKIFIFFTEIFIKKFCSKPKKSHIREILDILKYLSIKDQKYVLELFLKERSKSIKNNEINLLINFFHKPLETYCTYHSNKNIKDINIDVLSILERAFTKEFSVVSQRFVNLIISLFYKQRYKARNTSVIENYLGWLSVNHYDKYKKTFDWMVNLITKKGQNTYPCFKCMKDTTRIILKCSHSLCKDCACQAFIGNFDALSPIKCETCNYFKTENENDNNNNNNDNVDDDDNDDNDNDDDNDN
jgi:hypothetical protein